MRCGRLLCYASEAKWRFDGYRNKNELHYIDRIVVARARTIRFCGLVVRSILCHSRRTFRNRHGTRRRKNLFAVDVNTLFSKSSSTSTVSANRITRRIPRANLTTYVLHRTAFEPCKSFVGETSSYSLSSNGFFFSDFSFSTNSIRFAPSHKKSSRSSSLPCIPETLDSFRRKVWRFDTPIDNYRTSTRGSLDDSTIIPFNIDCHRCRAHYE